jgi:hypothetical protein
MRVTPPILFVGLSERAIRHKDLAVSGSGPWWQPAPIEASAQPGDDRLSEESHRVPSSHHLSLI